MSDRTPMSEAAQRRMAEKAAAMATTEDTAPGSRPVRKPFGRFDQKLAYPRREGYHRHWFNDEPGRIMRALEAGYKHVKTAEGANVCTVVGRGRDGGPLHGYLMEIPEEWYREDMAANDGEVLSRLAQIKQGRGPGTPSGQDAAAQYVPQTGIRIEEGARR